MLVVLAHRALCAPLQAAVAGVLGSRSSMEHPEVLRVESGLFLSAHTCFFTPVTPLSPCFLTQHLKVPLIATLT